ncbi:MAG TPA: DUF4124 domain-containing protein [Burkholderiales bacterium]|jgi:hypothetical protein|nr:DUF4124 domain-containing protein [Burkholderiales bacterium]
MNRKHASWWTLGAALLLLGAQAAQAETIYKYKGPDGVIVYSTTKPKNTPVLAEMDSAALASDPHTLYPAQAAAGGSASSTAADAHLQRLAEADANVRRAQQNLKNAQDALESGREPLPGERIGTVSGRSRLNDSYNQRLAALEHAVALAQGQLNEAYRARSNS